MMTDRAERHLAEWRLLYMPDEGVTIEDVDFFKDYVAVWESEDAEKYCRILPVQGGDDRFIEPPCEGAHMEPGINSVRGVNSLSLAQLLMLLVGVRDYDVAVYILLDDCTRGDGGLRHGYGTVEGGARSTAHSTRVR